MHHRFVSLIAVCLLSGLGCAGQPKQTYETRARILTLHTDPEGAQVTQFAPPQGTAVNLGTTPLVNCPVMVLTSFSGTFERLSTSAAMAAQINYVRVQIEKPGYTTWKGSIPTIPNHTTERTIVLEPTTRASASADLARFRSLHRGMNIEQ